MFFPTFQPGNFASGYGRPLRCLPLFTSSSEYPVPSFTESTASVVCNSSDAYNLAETTYKESASKSTVTTIDNSLNPSGLFALPSNLT